MGSGPNAAWDWWAERAGRWHACRSILSRGNLRNGFDFEHAPDVRADAASWLGHTSEDSEAVGWWAASAPQLVGLSRADQLAWLDQHYPRHDLDTLDQQEMTNMDTSTHDDDLADAWHEAEVAWSAVNEIGAELTEARRLLAPGIVGGMVALARLIAPAAPARPVRRPSPFTLGRRGYTRAA